MPKKTITTKVTLGIEDARHSVPEVRDAAGNILQPKTIGLGHALPGTPVTLDADEADAILARYGGEVLEEIADEEVEADQATDTKRGRKAPAAA